MDANLQRKALTDLKNELAAIVGKMESLSARKAQLESYIAQGQLLLGAAPESVLLPKTNPSRTPNKGSRSKKALWEHIAAVVRSNRHVMSVPQVLHGLTAVGVEVRGKYKLQAVRSEIARKTDVFEKVGPGLFALQEWPASLKQARKEPVHDETD